MAVGGGPVALRKRISAPGCDDAPVVSAPPMIGPARPVTLVLPYYDNPGMLERQIAGWLALHENLMPHVIVVDDGSPKYPARDVMRGAGLPGARLFRIEVDVRWNWIAARNLGMRHASGWCVLTDIDHVVPVETWRGLVLGRHCADTIYRFSRREHTGGAIAPHPNSWFMTADLFWRVGGYDEALSGHYGTDGDYRRRCAKAAPIRILTDELVRWEHVGDSSTTAYKRKQPEDRAVQRIIAARRPGWRPLVGSFPWHEVEL